MWIGRGDGTLMELSVQESVVSVLVEDRLVGGVFEAEHGIAATSSNNATLPHFPGFLLGFLLLLHMAHIHISHSTLGLGVHIHDQHCSALVWVLWELLLGTLCLTQWNTTHILRPVLGSLCTCWQCEVGS